jgi:DNA-binding beta-propeller fold protein YncE
MRTCYHVLMLAFLLVSFAACGGDAAEPGSEAALQPDSPVAPEPVPSASADALEASVPGTEAPLTEIPEVKVKDAEGVLAMLPVGQNPQQIAFSPDGSKAYVAVGRSDRVTVMDAREFLVSGSFDAPGIPMGVAVLPSSGDVLVSVFKDGAVARIDHETGQPIGVAETGEGSSMLTGPLPGEQFLVAAERDKRVSLLDSASMKVVASFPTSERPFPPAVNSDGTMGFIASYMDGTVTVIDVKRRMLKTMFRVGKGPSGLAVLPGDEKLAVALWEENRVSVVDIGKRVEVQSVVDGIGLQPLSVVVAPDGKLAFVNNRLSNDISVIRLPELLVVERVKVGQIPAAMAVHPSGETLWVSCEGDHQVYVLEILDRWTEPG